MTQDLSHDELKQHFLAGALYPPKTPGLKEAAREVLHPIIQSMKGRDIIYECRITYLMHVECLKMDDDGYRVVGRYLREVYDPPMAPWRKPTPQSVVCSIDSPAGGLVSDPLVFSGSWEAFHLCGSMVKMNWLVDSFFPDATVVTEVKSAMARNAPKQEIYNILERARAPRKSPKS